MTTIISFIPVFTMIGAEGKLFRPLAFTKTFALTASLIVALFLIPPFAAFLFRKKTIKKTSSFIINGLLVTLGIVALFYGYWLGLVLIAFGVINILKLQGKSQTQINNLKIKELSTLLQIQLAQLDNLKLSLDGFLGTDLIVAYEVEVRPDNSTTCWESLCDEDIIASDSEVRDQAPIVLTFSKFAYKYPYDIRVKVISCAKSVGL